MNNKTIRIFISSTFIGMEKERSMLMSKVFPNLAYEASLRGISVVPIDLRWGITQDDAENGKVIRTCLDEIENSKPYFIGLLGERYGWQPTFTDVCDEEDTLIKYPWLNDDINDHLSMTEIEMRFGVLRNDDNLSVKFYFKRSSEKIEEKQRHLIDDVKKHIIERGDSPKYYSSVDELGELVRSDFLKMLQDENPIMSYEDAFSNEKYSQNSFLNVFPDCLISRSDELNRISSFVTSDKQCLLMYSPSGYGKSALLSKFIKNNENQGNLNIIHYFLTDNNVKANPEEIVDYLVKSISERLNLSIEGNREIDNAFIELSNRFDKSLIVLDGVEKIKIPFDDNNSFLHWLPKPPRGIKYILSTNDEKIYNGLIERSDDFVELLPLSSSDIFKYIQNVTGSARKQLEEVRVLKIAEDPKSVNLNIVNVLVHDMINNCVFAKIDDFISRYNAAETMEVFISSLIDQAERVFNRDVVDEILTYFYVSGYGLAERELMNLCNIPQLVWSQFWCANPFLFVHSGDKVLLNRSIVNDAMMEKRLHNLIPHKIDHLISYLNDELAHKRNEDNLASKEDICVVLKMSLKSQLSDDEIKHYISRVIFSEGMYIGKCPLFNELIYQYVKLYRWGDLYNIISDPVCFLYMSKNYEYYTYTLLKLLKDKEYDVLKLYEINNENYYSLHFLCEYYFNLAHTFGLGLANSAFLLNCVNKSLEYASNTKDQIFIDCCTTHIVSYKASLCHDKEGIISLQKDQLDKLRDKEDSLSKQQYIDLSISYAVSLHGSGNSIKAQATLEDLLKELDKCDFSHEKYLHLIYEIKRNLANVICESNANKSSELVDEVSILYNQAYDESLQLIRINRKKYILDSIRILHDYSLFLFEEKKVDEARKLLEDGLKEFPMNERGVLIEYDEIWAHLCCTLTQIYTDGFAVNYDVADYRIALSYSNRSLGKSRCLYEFDNEKYAELYANSLYAKGRLMGMRNEYLIKCIDYYKESLSLYESLNIDDKILKVCFAIGNKLYRLTQFDEAICYLKLGLSRKHANLNKIESLSDYFKSLYFLKYCYKQTGVDLTAVNDEIQNISKTLHEAISDDQFNRVVRQIEEHEEYFVHVQS